MSTRMSLPTLPHLLTGRRGAWVTLLLAVLVSVGLVGALRGAELLDDHGSPPPGSEPAQVEDLLSELPGHDVQQLVVVLTRQDGAVLTDADLEEVRGTVAAELPQGLSAQTTGGPAFGADLAASFDGANLRLLLVTVGVVGLLLLTYRSPILWLVPIAVVGLADQVAGPAGAPADGPSKARDHQVSQPLGSDPPAGTPSTLNGLFPVAVGVRV